MSSCLFTGGPNVSRNVITLSSVSIAASSIVACLINRFSGTMSQIYRSAANYDLQIVFVNKILKVPVLKTIFSKSSFIVTGYA